MNLSSASARPRFVELSHRVEHGMRVYDGLPGFRFFAVPPPIVTGASFPVRAFAELGC